MKISKKRLGLGILASVLLLPAVAVAVSPFVDVIPGKFYEDPVNWAFNNEITTGKDATHFDPDGDVTRGESVTFLKRYNDNVVQPAIAGLGDTVGGLSCGAGELAKFDGTNWVCSTDTTTPNTDELAGLGCTSEQVAHFDGSVWVCGTIGLTYKAVPGVNSVLDTSGDVGEYSSITVGPDGFPIISYHDFTNRDLKVVHCTQPSCASFDTPVAVDTAGDVGLHTSIAVGSDGFAIISYYDFPNGDLKVVHCTVASCASFDMPVAVDTAGDVGEYTSIAVGSDGFPIISYYDFTSGGLKVVHCTVASCATNDAPTVLDGVGDVGLHTSIAVGADGFPIVSYYDFTNGGLKVVHCTVASCATNDAPIVLDTVGNVGQYSSIAVGADGLPIVSYYDATIDALKVVRCTVASCASFDPATTLDTGGVVGLHTSITVGADGLPIVSYYDVTNLDLKVVHCAVASCASSDTPTALDTGGSVGSYTSVALGVDGLPIISYYDGTNLDLKVAQVSMPTSGIAFR